MCSSRTRLLTHGPKRSSALPERRKRRTGCQRGPRTKMTHPARHDGGHGKYRRPTARSMGLSLEEVNDVPKVAVVTGGASGIGRRTVERLLTDGWMVWVFDGNLPAQDHQVRARSDGQVRYERCDVRDVENLRRAYGHV